MGRVFDSMIKMDDEIKILRSRLKSQERTIERLTGALKMALQAKPGLCGCESGGGITDLEPGFTCGYHAALRGEDAKTKQAGGEG